MTALLAAVKAPEIDYQGFAPVFATVGGAIVVLIAGLFPGRFVQRALVPLLAAAALVVAIVFSIVNWEPGVVEPIISGALSIDTLALFMSLLFYVAGLAAIALSLRSETRPGGRRRRVLRADARLDRRHDAARRRREPRDAVRRPRAAVDPALRALRVVGARPPLARVGIEVPGSRLGRLGDPALRPRLRLRRHGPHRLLRHLGRDRRQRLRRRPAAADRRRARGGRPRLQGVGRAVPSVDA